MTSYSMNQLSEITGKTYRTIKKRLAAAGLEPVGKEGRAILFDSANALDALYAPDREAAEAKANHTDYEAERVREVKERADNLELKNAQLRRELIPVELLSWTLGNLGAQISAILESIPVRVKRRMPKLGAAEVDIIKGEIAKCQNLASELKVDFDEYDPPGQA